MCKVMKVMFAFAGCCARELHPPLDCDRELATFDKSSPRPQTDPHLTALASTTPPTTARACLGRFTLLRGLCMGKRKQKKKGASPVVGWRLANKG